MKKWPYQFVPYHFLHLQWKFQISSLNKAFEQSISMRSLWAYSTSIPMSQNNSIIIFQFPQNYSREQIITFFQFGRSSLGRKIQLVNWICTFETLDLQDKSVQQPEHSHCIWKTHKNFHTVQIEISYISILLIPKSRDLTLHVDLNSQNFHRITWLECN